MVNLIGQADEAAAGDLELGSSPSHGLNDLEALKNQTQAIKRATDYVNKL